MLERTLSIIKPDAMAKGVADLINQRFIDAGLQIVKQKRTTLTKEEVEQFYEMHKDRSFFNDLVNYMISGEVIVQVLEGNNAVAKNREIMGATDPKNAALGTIRRDFADSIDANAVHGSDSLENAAKEIEFFFNNK